MAREAKLINNQAPNTITNDIASKKIINKLQNILIVANIVHEYFFIKAYCFNNYVFVPSQNCTLKAKPT